MANKVPANIPASVEVSYSDAGLYIGVTIWDDSGSSPVQVTGLSGMSAASVLPLLNWSGVSYRFKHQGTSGKWYLYQIAAYDSAYLTVDPTQPQGSDSLYFEDVAVEVLDVSAGAHDTSGTIGAAINASGGSSGSGSSGIIGVVGENPFGIIGIVGEN